MSIAPPPSCAFCEFPNTLGPHSPADCIDFLLRERDRLRAQLETAQAERDVLNGTACAEEQARGAGPCGACRNCWHEKLARVEAERDEAAKKAAIAVRGLNVMDAQVQAAEGLREALRRIEGLRADYPARDMREIAREAIAAYDTARAKP